jgi:hypothetical protein
MTSMSAVVLTFQFGALRNKLRRFGNNHGRTRHVMSCAPIIVDDCARQRNHSVLQSKFSSGAMACIVTPGPPEIRRLR